VLTKNEYTVSYSTKQRGNLIATVQNKEEI